MFKKKRFYLDLLMLTLVVFLIGVGLTACSQPVKEEVQEIQEFEKEVIEAEEENEAEEIEKEIEIEENEAEKIAEIYEGILEKIEDYEFELMGEEDVKSVEYSYSIVNMNEENETQMLVAKDYGYAITNIRVFSYDLEEEEIIAPDTILTIGVAPVGGFRGDLNQLKDKAALEYIVFSSGSGEGEISHITIEESDLIEDVVWDGRIDEVSEDRDLLVIDWLPISDLSKLKQLTEGEENFN